MNDLKDASWEELATETERTAEKGKAELTKDLLLVLNSGSLSGERDWKLYADTLAERLVFWAHRSLAAEKALAGMVRAAAKAEGDAK